MNDTSYRQEDIAAEAKAAMRTCPQHQRHGEHLQARKGTVRGVRWTLHFTNGAHYLGLIVTGFCTLCQSEVQTSVAI